MLSGIITSKLPLSSLNNSVNNYDEIKKIYSSIITIEMNKLLNVSEKISMLLKNCNENILQQLWLNVLKKSQSSSLIDIFKNELSIRDFHHNLWCHEALT